MAENVGAIEYTIDANTAEWLNQIQAVIKQNANLGKSFGSIDSEVKKFENSLSSAGMKISAQGKVVNAFGQVNEKLTNEYVALNKEMTLNAQRAEAANATMQRQIPQLNQVTKGIKGVQMSYQNLGYQIQDVAVMLQYGANPFLILSTQASQLLTGPMGAMIGAFAAIAGGIAMYLTQPSEEAAKSIEELVDQFEDLTEAQKKALQYKIGDEIAETGNKAEEAYGKMLALTEQVAAQERTLKKFEEGTQGGWLTNFVTDLDKQKKKLAELSKELDLATAEYDGQAESLEKLRKLLSDVIDGTAGQEEALKDLKETITEINSNYLLQIELLGKNEREQAKVTAKHKLGKKATDEQIASVNKLIDKYYDQKEASDALEESQRKLKQEQEKNAEVIKDLSEKLDVQKLASEGATEQAFVLAAQQKLGANATKEQKDEVAALATELYRLTSAQDAAGEAEKKLNEARSAISSSEAMSLGFEFGVDTAYLEAQYEAGLIAHEEYLASKMMLEHEYDEQMKGMIEERFRAESELNEFMMSSLDALGETASNVFSGMLSGTMSAKEAMASFAQAILNQAIGALVQMGIEQVKQQVIGASAMAATSAAAAASGAAMAASYAPAAAMASLASFGANAAPAQAGITSTVAMSQGLAFGGGRATGGPVNANSFYRMGEGNRPEVMQTGAGLFAVPGDKGRVFNGSQLDKIGGNSAPVINVYPMPGETANVSQNDDGSYDIVIAKLVEGMDSHSGPFYDSLMRNTDTKAKLGG